MTYQDKTNIKKIGYTIFVILACLILSHIPVWGLSSDTLGQLFKVPILIPRKLIYLIACNLLHEIVNTRKD